MSRDTLKREQRALALDLCELARLTYFKVSMYKMRLSICESFKMPL